VVVDATGDGDIAVSAGAKYGIRKKEELMTATLLFRMDNVNMDQLKVFTQREITSLRVKDPMFYLKEKRYLCQGFEHLIVKARPDGIAVPQDWGIIMPEVGEGIVGINMAIADQFDPTNVLELSFAES
jgi:hypothetical protein